MPDNEIPLDEAIDTLADKFGVPRPLWRRLVGQESSGNVDVGNSSKGARGLFQIMPATARNLRKPDGTPINPDDPLEAAYGGLKLLSDNYKQFRPLAKSDRHAWGMALAGYHGNPKSVLRDLQQGGLGIPDQDDGAINTQDYVANILRDVPDFGPSSHHTTSAPEASRPKAAPPGTVGPGQPAVGRNLAEQPSLPTRLPPTVRLPDESQLPIVQEAMAATPTGQPPEAVTPEMRTPEYWQQQVVAAKQGQIDKAFNQTEAETAVAKARHDAAAHAQRLLQRAAARRARQQQQVGLGGSAAVSTGLPTRQPFNFQTEKTAQERLSELGPLKTGPQPVIQPTQFDDVRRQIRAQVVAEREARKTGPMTQARSALAMRDAAQPGSAIEDEVGQRLEDYKRTLATPAESALAQQEINRLEGQNYFKRIWNQPTVESVIHKATATLARDISHVLPAGPAKRLNELASTEQSEARIADMVQHYAYKGNEAFLRTIGAESAKMVFSLGPQILATEATGIPFPLIAAGSSYLENGDKRPSQRLEAAGTAYVLALAYTRGPAAAVSGAARISPAIARLAARYPEMTSRFTGGALFGTAGAIETAARGGSAKEVLIGGVTSALPGIALGSGKRLAEELGRIPESAIQAEWLPERVRTAAARAKGYQPTIVQTDEAEPRFASVYYKSPTEQFVQRITPEQAAEFNRAAKGEKARPFITVEPTQFDLVAGFSGTDPGSKPATSEYSPMKRQIEAKPDENISTANKTVESSGPPAESVATPTDRVSKPSGDEPAVPPASQSQPPDVVGDTTRAVGAGEPTAKAAAPEFQKFADDAAKIRQESRDPELTDFERQAFERKAKRLEEKAKGVEERRSGADPYELMDDIIISGGKLYRKAKPTFEEWSQKIREEFGAESEEHLDTVWKGLGGALATSAPPKIDENITKVITKGTQPNDSVLPQSTAERPGENHRAPTEKPTAAAPNDRARNNDSALSAEQGSAAAEPGSKGEQKAAGAPQPQIKPAPKLIEMANGKARVSIPEAGGNRYENFDTVDQAKTRIAELTSVSKPEEKGGVPAPAEAAGQGIAKKGNKGGLDREETQTATASPAATKPGEPDPNTGRKFSSTQVDLPPAEAKLQKKAAAAIPDSELAADGREEKPHITVKYGLHTDNAEELNALLADEPPIKATIGKVSIFPAKQGTEQRGGAEYDVVKMDVDSPDLHRLNAKISKALPVTDTHPEYKPHVTLAYVKPGEGAKYVGQANALTGKEITLDKILFSSKSGKEVEIPLKGAAQAAESAPSVTRETMEVPRVAGLSPEEQAVEDRFIDLVRTKTDELIDDYRKRFTNDAGVLVISGDSAKELSPDYNASPASRAQLARVVHGAASALTDVILDQELAKPPEPGKDRLMITGGGAGAGKSSSLRELARTNPETFADVGLVIDTNSAHVESSIKKIEAALASGRKVTLFGVYRDPVDALVNGVLTRSAHVGSADEGRTLPLSVIAQTHVGFAQTIQGLADKYANNPDVSIVVIDNTRGLGKSAVSTVDIVKVEAYNTVFKALREALENEHDQGHISEAIYQGTIAGLKPVGRAESPATGERLFASTQPSGSKELSQTPADQVGTDELPQGTSGGTGLKTTDTLGPDGQEALGGVPANALSEPEGLGGSSTSAAIGPGQSQGSLRAPGESGNGSVSSGGIGTEGIHLPAGGDGPGTQREGPGEPVDHTIAAADAAAAEPQTSDEIVEGAESRAAENNPDSGKSHALTLTGDFFVEDVDAFSSGSLKQKYQRNIDAIVTLRRIQAEGRERATPEEQATMARFIGWGQFPGLFNEHTAAGGQWAEERQALKGLLSPEEFRSARGSILNAHYTAPQIVKSMWDIARRLGFRRGRVLEPSMGSGNFFALMPRDIRKHSPIVGIELDKTTGAIAQLLYPNADVQVKGYEEYAVSDDFFDLITSNFPFGDYQVADPRYPQKLKSQIHDYFFVKSLDKVRPGGIVLGITSTGTMDKGSQAVRAHLAERADLVAAMRLPSNTFLKEAGTAVVTDIIILRKRIPGEEVTPELQKIRDNKWLELKEVPDPLGHGPIPVNEYFADHPEMVIGRLDRSGELYREHQKGVTRQDDFEDHFQTAISSIPQGMYRTKKNKAFEPQLLPAPDEVKQGSFVAQDGKIYQKVGVHLIEQSMSPETVKRVAGMIGIRDVENRLFNAELHEADTAPEIRKELNKVYDAFVKKHGYISAPENLKPIADDPDRYRLLALEKINRDTKKVTKSDIFTMATLSQFEPATSAKGLGDAVSISLNERGAIDLDRIADLLSTTAHQVGEDLVKQGIAFNDPRGGWVSRGEYLTGRVRQKLLEAQEAARTDPAFKPNVEALTEAQPEDRPYSKIQVRIGATWIPPADVAQFMADQMNVTPSAFSVHYSPTTGTWAVSYSEGGSGLRGNQKDKEELGTPDKSFPEIIEAAITDKPIQIRRTAGDGTTFLDRKASAAAMQRVKKARKLFERWIWQDDERRERLHRKYNDTYNDTIPLRVDGSHQTFPGMNPIIAAEWASGTRDHQPNVVYRAVTRGTVLMGHEVGTGKSFSMVAMGMERRRLGLSRKPTIAVPNSNVAQLTDQAHFLYPNARILAAHEGMDPDKRQKTITQIATGDWDLVILTHDNLELIPMSAETQERFIRKELEELEAAVHEARRASGGDKDKAGNRIVKQLEKKLKDREAALKNIIEKPKDPAMTFEETGIDFLMVDEAHKFKSLPVYTARGNVKGIPTTKSDRATNMYMRTQWLLERNNGQGVVFATGTPISNTMVELFNMQRFLQRADLEVRGIDKFDGWAALFGETTSKHEFKPTGDWEVTTRFNRFTNLPQLAQISGEVIDVAFAKDIPGITRPKRNDKIVTVPMSPDQKAYLDVIRQRARALGHMHGPPQKGDDNWLVLGTDAKKAAIDMRLIDRHYEDDPNSKLNKLVEETLAFAKANKGKTQLIFSDMGVNVSPKGISLYADIIKKLVKGGIKRDQIVDFSQFAPGNKSHQKARAEGMERLNSGKAKVGIGGTEKMGTGVNVQKKLAELRHLDAPPRPSDVEQRDGRGWRDGNENEEIGITRYTTEGSFDVNSWQILDNKRTFIKQFLDGMTTGSGLPDTFEDEDDEFNYARVMAVTSGNPLLMKKMDAERELSELESDFEVFNDTMLRARDRTAQLKRSIEWNRARMKTAEQDLPVYQASLDKPWSVTIDGKEYTRDLEEEKVAAAQEAKLREKQDKVADEKKALKQIVAGLKAEAKEKGLKSGKETTEYIQKKEPNIVKRLKEMGDDEAEIELPPTKIGDATKAFRKSISTHIKAIETNWNLTRRMRDEEISEPFAQYRGFNVVLVQQTQQTLGENQVTKYDYVPALVGPSGDQYRVNWAMPRAGAVFEQMDNELRDLDRIVRNSKQTIAENEKKIEEAASLTDQVYPEQAALDAKRREVDVLTQQLTASGGSLPLPEDYSDLSTRYLPDGKLKQDEQPIDMLAKDQEWQTNTIDGQPAFTDGTLTMIGEPTGPHSEGWSPSMLQNVVARGSATEGDRVAPFAIEDLTNVALLTNGARLDVGYLDIILDHYPNVRLRYTEKRRGYGSTARTEGTLSIVDGKKLVGVVNVKGAKPLDKEFEAAAKIAIERAMVKDTMLDEAEKLIRPMRGPARRMERPRVSAAQAMGEAQPRAARAARPGPVEMFSGLPFLRSLFSPKPRNVGVNVPPTASDFAEVEERWKAAKGIKVPGGLAKATEALRNFFRSFKRHYIHLDPNKDEQTALTSDILRLHEASPAWAKAMAYDHLVEITGQLNDKAVDVLTRNLVLPDILKDIEDGLYDADPETGRELRELPFGYESKAQVEQDLEKFKALAEANPEIQDAIDRRKAITGAITRRLVALDLLHPDVLNDDRYYHRQVLKYVNAQEFVSTGTGGGVRLTRKGFQKERAGGGDFNVRYQEAEFEWLSQAYSLIAKQETLDQIDAVNNIVDDLKRQAKTLNIDALAAKFGAEEPEEITKARSNIGRANAELKEMAKDGTLSSANGRYDDLIQDLASTPKKQPFNHPDWFGFLSHLLENDLPGKIQAAMIFKAIAEREKFIKDELGKDFKTWQDVVPDTHAIWQPEKGNLFYMASTVEEKALARILAGDKALEASDIKNQMVVGGKRAQWVMPKEVVQTLEDMKGLPSDDPVESLWVLAQNTWKQWVLLNPSRAVVYNFNNMSGDLDITLAYDPRILKHFTRAAMDLWRHQVTHTAEPALKAEILEAIKLGVVDTGLTITEIPDINKAGAFRALVEEDQNLLARGVQSYWGGIKNFTSWRENILRLAAFRYFLEHGGYGASNPDQVDAIPGRKEKAAKLARELIGDYGNVSVAGQWIRRHLIPFYSWVEINAPRYVQLLKNTARESGESKGGRFRFGAVTAKKLAMLLLKAHILLGLISLWNHLKFPEEEKELRREGRKPHIILGRAPDGSIRTLKFQGALADALEWFGFDDWPSDVADLLSGRKDWKDQAAEAVKAPAERMVNSLEPFSKSIFELATGRQLYPHFFREGKSFEMAARPIRDRQEYAARVFSLGALYNRITGKPVRPITKDPVWGTLETFLIYRTDPGEAAYWEVRGRLAQWQEQHGRMQQSAGDPTERQNALYYFKQASKWGDDPAAKKWLAKYRELGGTDKGMIASIRVAHPLGSLARKDWNEFAGGLTPEEKLMLKQSIDWYKKTYGDVPIDDDTLQEKIDRVMEGERGSKRQFGPQIPRPPGHNSNRFGEFQIPTP